MRREERKRTSVKTEAVEPSSGNVFADLGLKNPEELLAKAEIVQRISDIIAQRKLSQAMAPRNSSASTSQKSRPFCAAGSKGSPSTDSFGS